MAFMDARNHFFTSFFRNNKFRAIKFSHRLENLNLPMCVFYNFLQQLHASTMLFSDKSFVMLFISRSVHCSQIAELSLDALINMLTEANSRRVSARFSPCRGPAERTFISLCLLMTTHIFPVSFFAQAGSQMPRKKWSTRRS